METPGRIEPCLLETMPIRIADLANKLAVEAQKLESALPAHTAEGLASYVRIMNCYYSNLIEGHNTLPRDIEKAFADDIVSDDQSRRNLQIEARAHIHVQRYIDTLHERLDGSDPASTGFIKTLHRMFYKDATEEMLTIKGRERNMVMQPGEFRHDAEWDVSVGRHMPPSGPFVENFMQYFEKRYGFEHLGMSGRIIAMAASHHRLNYIHPFPDGNGRVSRLMSHAMGLKAGIGAHGLWSVSRGLARGLESRSEYKSMMDMADMPRQGDLDGRGNLSLKALEDFIEWFLKVCVDQVMFMASLFDLANMERRLTEYARIREWPQQAVYILHDVLRRGEVPRGDVPRITGMPERTARNLLVAMTTDGILASETPRRPVRLSFPVHSAEILFPRLVAEMQG